MISQFKQYVPSSTCLDCDGCCRFKSADSPWRPRMGAQEKAALAMRVARHDFTDDRDYVTAIGDCGNQLCQFFNKNDSTCKVYESRPFECALYPFILSRSGDGIKVFVHLACPHIQDTQADEALVKYIAYLKELFAKTATMEFLKRNQGLLHDYTPFELELQYLFTIDECGR